MEMKTFVWGGFFAGSGIGSFLPYLWGAGALSFTAVIMSAVGGIVGIFAGYALGKWLT